MFVQSFVVLKVVFIQNFVVVMEDCECCSYLKF